MEKYGTINLGPVNWDGSGDLINMQKQGEIIARVTISVDTIIEELDNYERMARMYGDPRYADAFLTALNALQSVTYKP